MEKKWKSDQVEPVMVPEVAPEEPWLPSAKQMLMEAEKGRFTRETEERGEAREWVKSRLYPAMQQAAHAGDESASLSHDLRAGVLRHVVEYLKGEGYYVTQSSPLTVGWSANPPPVKR